MSELQVSCRSVAGQLQVSRARCSGGRRQKRVIAIVTVTVVIIVILIVIEIVIAIVKAIVKVTVKCSRREAPAGVGKEFFTSGSQVKNQETSGSFMSRVGLFWGNVRLFSSAGTGSSPAPAAASWPLNPHPSTLNPNP